MELGRKTPVDHCSNYCPLPVADLGGGEAGSECPEVHRLGQLAAQLEGQATTTAEVMQPLIHCECVGWLLNNYVNTRHNWLLITKITVLQYWVIKLLAGVLKN